MLAIYSPPWAASLTVKKENKKEKTDTNGLGLTIVWGWRDLHEFAHEVVQLHVPEAVARLVHLEVWTEADEGGLQ